MALATIHQPIKHPVLMEQALVFIWIGHRINQSLFLLHHFWTWLTHPLHFNYGWMLKHSVITLPVMIMLFLDNFNLITWVTLSILLCEISASIWAFLTMMFPEIRWVINWSILTVRRSSLDVERWSMVSHGMYSRKRVYSKRIWCCLIKCLVIHLRLFDDDAVCLRRRLSRCCTQFISTLSRHHRVRSF